MQNIKYLKQNYLLILIIMAISFVFSINIAKPFIGHHDFNSAFFSIIAKNLSENSIFKTKLGQIENSGRSALNHPVYYTHNVPLFTWVLALTFFIFGNGEMQARTVSILFSVGCVVFIYKIAKALFSKLVATISILFYSFSAMIIYFSSVVFPEPVAIFFSLAGFYFYIKWLKERKEKEFKYLLIFSFLSLLTVWGSYFLPPFIIVHFLIFNKKKDFKKILIYAFLPFFTFTLFLIHIYILTGNFFGGGLFEAFLFRTNQDANPLYAFSLINFISRESHLLIAYYSKITMVLVISWFIYYMFIFMNRKNMQTQSLILVLFAWGATYPLLFSNASYIHDYFLIYLAPFISISAALMATKLCLLIFKNRFKYKLITLIIFVFPLLQFLETKNFALALLQTNANRDGFYLGKFLKTETMPSDKIIVLSNQFGAHFGVFTNYYSNRNVSYSDVKLADYKKESIDKEYDYAVLVRGREAEKVVEDYLNKNYLRKDLDIYQLYNLKK